MEPYWIMRDTCIVVLLTRNELGMLSAKHISMLFVSEFKKNQISLFEYCVSKTNLFISKLKFILQHL